MGENKVLFEAGDWVLVPQKKTPLDLSQLYLN